MLDVIDQLQRYGDAIAETVKPVRATDVTVVTTQPPRPRRPVWQPLVAAAAVVVLLAGGLWFASESSDSSSEPGVTTGPRDGIELLPGFPLEPRGDAAVVWTGDELMVWGGDIEAANMGLPGPDRQYNDGAAYNPATRTWRTMAPSPLPATKSGVSAVATDQGVVIARGTSVALWNRQTNTWRQLDDVPRTIEEGAVPDLTDTGSGVISVAANATLDPETGRWQSLPEPPLQLGRPVPIWTGEQLVVVGQVGFYTPGAIAYDPERGTWRELSVPPALIPAAMSAARDGERVIYVDYENHVVSYSNTDEWKVLPSVPSRFYESSPTIAVLPPALVVRASGAFAVRIGDGPWNSLPLDELEFGGYWMPVAPAGTARDRASLFVFGLTRSGQNRLALVDPERLATSARTLQVGVVTVRLPEGVTLSGSDYDDTQGNEEVLVRLNTPTGTCTMTSQYGEFGSAGNVSEPALEQYTAELMHLRQVELGLEQRLAGINAQMSSLPADSDRVVELQSQKDAIYRSLEDVGEQRFLLTQRGPQGLTGLGPFYATDASRTHWFAQATDSDAVKISCPDAATAEQLVDATTTPNLTPVTTTTSLVTPTP